MKRILFLFLLLPVLSYAQTACGGFMYEGILKSKVNANAVTLIDDSVCRPCGIEYEMHLEFLPDNKINWIQYNVGNIAFCMCHYNLSTTLDSLSPGIYTVSVFDQWGETEAAQFIGNISFQISNPVTFQAATVTAHYQSPCYEINVNEPIENNNNVLHLFPNPSAGIIHLVDKISDTKIIRIIDLNNRCLLDFKTVNKENVIDLSNYSSGIYFVELYSEMKVYHARIFLQ